MSEASEQPESKVKQVLEAAEKDLENAEYAGIVGPVANPIKDHVVSPVVHMAGSVLPAVTTHVPLLDGFSAMILGVTFQGIKVGYSILPHVKPIQGQAEDQLKEAANQARDRAAAEVEDTNEHDLKDALLIVPKAINAMCMAGAGYLLNTALDLISRPDKKLQAWKESSEMFLGFLAQFGIDKELTRAINNPRTTENVIITANIQRAQGSVGSRRSQTALKEHPLSKTQEQDLFFQASRFIKFAVAAYGVYMIECTNEVRSMINASSDGSKDPDFLKEAGGKDVGEILDLKLVRFAKYLDIDRSDIVYATIQGKDIKLIDHYVAVDHQTKSVVLAIRGTHDTTDCVADFSASAVPFCGGVAHKGQADYANYLWEYTDTRNAIVRALFANKGYAFVVTGQSLGAGVANLVHIRCHHDGENLFRGIKSTCFAFGSNPCYAEKQSAQVSAHAASCFNFVHGADVVAFSSVDSVRRLLRTLEEVDSVVSKMSFKDQVLLVRGAKQPSDELVEIVTQGSKNLEPKPGAERLKLPSAFIIWIKLMSEDPLAFDTAYCDPKEVSDLPILLDVNNMPDHMPFVYEIALNNMAV